MANDENMAWCDNGLLLKLNKPILDIRYTRTLPEVECSTCYEKNMVLYVYSGGSREAHTYCPKCYERRLLGLLDKLYNDFPQLKEN